MPQLANLPLKENELVVEVVRPTTIPYFGRYVLAAAILGVNSFFTFWFLQQGIEGKIFYGIVWLLGLYLLIYTVFFEHTNYLVVTTERIFDIHHRSLFNETLSALSFLDVSDIVIERRGFFSTVFNYGLITIHPKDGKFTFEIERVPKPGEVQNLLFERRQRHARDRKFESKAAVYEQMLKMIPDLSEAELTLLYQKVHSQLLSIAGTSSENAQ